jgi:hypothetical protein
MTTSGWTWYLIGFVTGAVVALVAYRAGVRSEQRRVRCRDVTWNSALNGR